MYKNLRRDTEKATLLRPVVESSQQVRVAVTNLSKSIVFVISTFDRTDVLGTCIAYPRIGVPGADCFLGMKLSLQALWLNS